MYPIHKISREGESKSSAGAHIWTGRTFPGSQTAVDMSQITESSLQRQLGLVGAVPTRSTIFCFLKSSPSFRTILGGLFMIDRSPQGSRSRSAFCLKRLYMLTTRKSVIFKVMQILDYNLTDKSYRLWCSKSKENPASRKINGRVIVRIIMPATWRCMPA